MKSRSQCISRSTSCAHRAITPLQRILLKRSLKHRETRKKLGKIGVVSLAPWGMLRVAFYRRCLLSMLFANRLDRDDQPSPALLRLWLLWGRVLWLLHAGGISETSTEPNNLHGLQVNITGASPPHTQLLLCSE